MIQRSGLTTHDIFAHSARIATRCAPCHPQVLFVLGYDHSDIPRRAGCDIYVHNQNQVWYGMAWHGMVWYIIGVNHPAIVREIPHFCLFPAFPHFCENVPHFWLYFEITKIAKNRNNLSCTETFCSKTFAKTSIIVSPSH